MSDLPLVSVIIPTFNRASLLYRSIESVLKQSYGHWELIIVDDGSTDNTKEVVKKYMNKDARIKYLCFEENKGVSISRNYGIAESNGEYVAFLDSDDKWEVEHLHNSIKTLIKEDTHVSFALWKERTSSGREYKIFDNEKRWEVLNMAIKELNTISREDVIVFPSPAFFEFSLLARLYCCQINTMVCSKEVFKKAGLFNNDLLASEDIEFITRVVCEFEFCLILHYHCTYYEGEDNLHNFINRRKINLDDILNNKEVIKKLTFCGIYKCKSLKLGKRLIKDLKTIKKGKLCLIELNKRIAIKYFTMGFINKKESKIKSIKFILGSVIYGYRKNTLKLITNILFPSAFKNINVGINDLWLY